MCAKNSSAQLDVFNHGARLQIGLLIKKASINIRTFRDRFCILMEFARQNGLIQPKYPNMGIEISMCAKNIATQLGVFNHGARLQISLLIKKTSIIRTFCGWFSK